jgi:AraC-like DNA-binding protein
MRHANGEWLPRHMHAGAFFALVLEGNYVEAGDTGRHRVGPGDVIFHGPYERHLDRVSRRGAEVLVVPALAPWKGPVLGCVGDADQIAKIAERDMTCARATLREQFIAKRSPIEDWPDLLARDLIADPDLSLSDWASRHHMHRGSLARGFRQQFETTPESFRTVTRARSAIERIISGQAPLADVALGQGFADQAHMSRTVKRLTGLSPHALRTREGPKSAGELGMPLEEVLAIG